MLRISALYKARAPSLLVPVRCCSSAVVEKSKESLEAISRRKAFKSIDLDMKIMDRLDAMNVGFLPKRKSRVAVAQKFDPNSSRFKEERFEEEKRLPFPFRGTGKVLNNAETKDQIPNIKGSPPEIALIGRSNVGKSTLVNTLLGFDSSYVQKAKVTDKPGETTHLTFYQIGSSYKPPSKMAATSQDPAFANEPDKLFKTPALVLTDMPGYGFAFMSEKDKMRCHMLCLDYLISNVERNKVLKRVVLLLDGRHGLKASDIMFLQDLQRHLIEKVVSLGGPDSKELQNILPTPAVAPSSDVDAAEAALPPPILLSGKATKILSRYLGWKLQIVLTKCDLVDRPELCRRITDVSRTVSDKLPALYHSMLPVLALSAQEKKGVQEMQRDIAALVPPRWEEDPDIKKNKELHDVRKIKKDSTETAVHNHNRAKFTIKKEGSESKLGKFGIFNKSHEAKVVPKKDPNRPSFAERRQQRIEENLQKLASGLSLNSGDGGSNKRLSFADRVKERKALTAKAAAAAASGEVGSESNSKRSAGRRHFDDYADEIDEYFGDEDLDNEELLDSDFEDGDVEGYDDDFDYDDADEDDVGVNWRAAGEIYDDFSDEEDELLAEAQLAGEVGGYRNKGPSAETRQIVYERRRALAREASTANGARGSKGGKDGNAIAKKRTVPFQKKGNFPGDIQRTKVGGQWRVAKTAWNPKGRHRYANPVKPARRDDNRSGDKRTGDFKRNDGKGSSNSKPKEGKGDFKGTYKGTSGAGKGSPKGEQKGRNRYY